MFRSLSKLTSQSVRNCLNLKNIESNPSVVAVCRFSSKRQESDEEFDARYEAYFNKPNIDGWEIRKGMNDLTGMDLVPEPKIVIAALKACRRVNDFALAVRYLEAVKEKCGRRVKEIYPYMLQEIRPTLDELGINTPEEMGYDKPELDWEDVFAKPLFRKKK